MCGTLTKSCKIPLAIRPGSRILPIHGPRLPPSPLPHSPRGIPVRRLPLRVRGRRSLSGGLAWSPRLAGRSPCPRRLAQVRRARRALGSKPPPSARDPRAARQFARAEFTPSPARPGRQLASPCSISQPSARSPGRKRQAASPAPNCRVRAPRQFSRSKLFALYILPWVPPLRANSRSLPTARGPALFSHSPRRFRGPLHLTTAPGPRSFHTAGGAAQPLFTN